MIFRSKRHNRGGAAYGYFQLEEERQHTKAFGFGSGSYIKLTDELGNTWIGTCEAGEDNVVYYRFRTSEGNTMTGISQNNGILLRDQRGRTWKGFVE